MRAIVIAGLAMASNAWGQEAASEQIVVCPFWKREEATLSVAPGVLRVRFGETWSHNRCADPEALCMGSGDLLVFKRSNGGVPHELLVINAETLAFTLRDSERNDSGRCRRLAN